MAVIELGPSVEREVRRNHLAAAFTAAALVWQRLDLGGYGWVAAMVTAFVSIFLLAFGTGMRVWFASTVTAASVVLLVGLPAVFYPYAQRHGVDGRVGAGLALAMALFLVLTGYWPAVRVYRARRAETAPPQEE
jgi:hypothetical protein